MTGSKGEISGSEASGIGRTLSFKLSLIARAIRHGFDTRARSTGLTSAQWRTVAVVKLAEGSTQNRIARLLDVGDVTAGRMIDRLCDEGLIERRPDPADRRAHRVYLTPAAGPLLETLHHLATAEDGRAYAGLSTAEMAQLHGLLDRISANLRSPWNEPPVG